MRSNEVSVGSGVRGRIAERRQPILDSFTGQTFVGACALVPSPSSGFQVVVGTKQLEKAVGDTLLHIEKGAQGGVESFDGAGGAMPPSDDVFHGG